MATGRDIHVLHYQHTFVLTGLPGLLLLVLLLVVFVLGSVHLLLALSRGVRAFRTSGESTTEEQWEGDTVGLFQALWAVPGKVRVGNVTVHVGWITISLGVTALLALLR